MKSDIEINREIADAIHYPECWDVGAYPTLACALFEMLGDLGKCSSCREMQGTTQKTKEKSQ